MKATTMLLGLAVATGLAVPAHAQGHNPPGVNPTHYQCYRLEAGQTQPVKVKLQDQFGASSPVAVLRPTLLCAPTVKNGMPIRDRLTHYLCYEDEGVKTPGRKVRIINQFGAVEVVVEGATTLCVPSLKRLL